MVRLKIILPNVGFLNKRFNKIKTDNAKINSFISYSRYIVGPGFSYRIPGFIFLVMVTIVTSIVTNYFLTSIPESSVFSPSLQAIYTLVKVFPLFMISLGLFKLFRGTSILD